MRYVLVSDAISRRTESVVDGFSGKVVDEILKDFPEAKLVHITRDPRATFASPRHQFVNSLGNMYGVSTSSITTRMRQLLTRDFSPDNGAVYLYWLLYLAQTARTVRRKKREYQQNFVTVRNEDLNLNFAPTIERLLAWLGVSNEADFQQEPFVPTILGRPWRGAGAYNSSYQRHTNGPLQNDSPEQSKAATGPNRHVTERWKTRLNKREIQLIECLFRQEIQDLDYEFLCEPIAVGQVPRLLLGPFNGEVPAWSWIKLGKKEGARELFQRLFYSVTFPPFYVMSRVILTDFVLRLGSLKTAVQCLNKLIT